MNYISLISSDPVKHVHYHKAVMTFFRNGVIAIVINM